MFRRNREERAVREPAAHAGPSRYQLRERLFDIGDDFWIEGPVGRRIFKVDGKALRLRNTLNIEDAFGNVVVQIQQRVLRVRHSVAIERGGSTIAEVHKDLINIVHDHFHIDRKDGAPDMEASGNILDHEYHITQAGHMVAEVSRKWLRVRDTYGIEVAAGQDDALVLAIAVAIDQLTHAGEG